MRTAFSRASAAIVAAPAMAGACVQIRAFAEAPVPAEVASFEKAHGDSTRATVATMFKDLGMQVPPAVAEGRPIGELLESVNDSFMGELALPENKLKEAFSMRSKIKEAFAKQEETIVPKMTEIDWEGYKAAIGDAALVDQFKSAMEKTLSDPMLKSPVQPEGEDPLMKTVADAEKAMEELSKAVAADVKEGEAKLAQLQVRAKEIEAEIAAIDGAVVTIDSELTRYPDIAAKIDAEILEDKW